MRRLLIEERARDDLGHILRFIAMRNPTAAERTLDRIAAVIDGLLTFSTGKRGRLPGTFEKVVPGLPYIVVYKVKKLEGQEVIAIVLVHHTSRAFPSSDI